MLEFIKKNYLIFCTFIIVRIFFYILLNILDRDLLTVLQFMDGENYIDIANNGYNKKYLYAFFPLIPLLIRYFGIYFVFILNNILVLLSAILLKKEYNESTALLFLLSPIQIYCSILYTESIFIFLCILSIYLIKRKKYILTGLCLGIGVCCRSMMSMLFFSIFIVMCYDWYKKNCTFKDILKTYIPATIISCIYPIYLQIVTGNWKLFNDIQFEWWSAEKSNIFKTIMLDIIRYLETRDNYELFLISLTYISLFGLILVLINSYDIDKRLVLFTLFTILITFSICRHVNVSGTMHPSVSFFRYFFGCFPIYIALSKYKILPYIILILLLLIISTNFIFIGWPF